MKQDSFICDVLHIICTYIIFMININKFVTSEANVNLIFESILYLTRVMKCNSAFGYSQIQKTHELHGLQGSRV